MKADNLFRFVSVRPPSDAETIERIPGDERAIDDVGERLAGNLSRGGSASDAAMDTGREIIRGEDYIRSWEWGDDILRAAGTVQSLLREAQQRRDWQSFQDEAQKLLAGLSRSNTPAEAVLRSDTFADLETTLWRSYFATVLNPYERAKDQESLRVWLVFLYLAESQTAAEFSRRAGKIPSIRPSVPASFFSGVPTQPESGEPAEQPAPGRHDGAELAAGMRDQIASLEGAREELNALFADRVQRTAYAVRTNTAKSRDTAGGGDPARTGSAVAGQSSSSIESSQAAAWRLTADDLRTRERLVETVRTAGILPELSTIPDAINRLDTEIARLHAELSGMDSDRDVALVGNTFVRLRRPTALSYDEVR